MTSLTITAETLKSLHQETVRDILNMALEKCEVEPQDAVELANECGLSVTLQLSAA